MRFTTLQQNNDFLVLENTKPLLNHIEKPLPAFSKEIAELLASDLNEVFDFGKDQLNFSFVYCGLSTMYQDLEKFEPSVDVAKWIQWDQVYRLSPGPPHNILQHNAIAPLMKFLEGDWQDLQLNYAQSLEEMEEMEVPFVSKKIIGKIDTLYKSFNSFELFSVELLNQFYNSSNISFPILWVSGNMSSYELQYNSSFFSDLKNSFELNKEEEIILEFYVKRLDALWELLKLSK